MQSMLIDSDSNNRINKITQSLRPYLCIRERTAVGMYPLTIDPPKTTPNHATS